MSSRRFEGRVAAVTGASGRLGRLVAEAFEAEGAHVAALVHHDSKARLLPVTGESRVRSYTCDATDGKSVVEAFENLASDFGRLDALVHTVGGWAETPLRESSAGEWDRVIRLNLLSTFLCFREAARIMTAGDGGGLVAVASAQGADRGAGGQSAYSAAKAGVIRLVESTAEELADEGVTARAVAPSMILYGAETGDGVPADTIVRLCIDCSIPGGAIPSGGLVRAYGSASRDKGL